MRILLAPEKLVTSTSKDQWQELQCDITLFTSRSSSYMDFLHTHLKGIFKHIEFFDNYPNNDTVEIKLFEYAKKYNIKNIIPMTEADVLRASKVREKLGIAGLSYTNALKFRDKILMKELAREFNINIPRFRRIKDTVDILEFVEEVGYPIIIKPILGRGSLNTLIISNQGELIALLNGGLISDTSRYTDLLAEEFLDADIYHIDGLQLNYQIKVMSVSKYINNCLSFVGGSYLGSYTLDMQNPIRNTLVHFSLHLLSEVYPLYKNALFHIEVFVGRDNKISLCEVACRIGGNGINDEVKLQQGVDIKMEYIKEECGLENIVNHNDKLTHPIAGRLLVPPREAKLISFPEKCDISGVIRYQFRGRKDNKYKKMAMSNDEIANFLIISSSENEICEKIAHLSSWFDDNVTWE